MNRRNDGFDLTPIFTNYIFLLTTILAVAGWFIAFIGQAVATAQLGNGSVGVVWFAIFLQLVVILGVLYTLATGTTATHRIQISIFGAICIVFAVFGVNEGIFSPAGASNAFGAGWLILAMVDIIWVLYFSSEDGSLILHIFDSLGGGVSTNRRRRLTHNGGDYNSGAYADGGQGQMYRGGGISSNDVPNYAGGPPAVSQHSLGVPKSPASIGMSGPNTGISVGMSQPVQSSASIGPTAIQPQDTGLSAAGSASGIAVASPGPSGLDNAATGDSMPVRAKALYAYQASPDDPNEISFSKGEILEIMDKQGKWWQAKKSDGTMGIAPSNYLQII